MRNKKLGAFGENIAGRYLENKGYKIIGRNIKINRLELDIIATKNKRLYFFEIKTRLNNKMTDSEKLISNLQSANLKKAALRYTALNKINTDLISFDLIAILLEPQNNKVIIKHFANIF